MQRRLILKTILGAMILLPMQVFAKANDKLSNMLWNKSAFESEKISVTTSKLNISHETVSQAIEIIAPDKAENGAIVQVQVTSHLPNTESIVILAEHNPTPLIAEFIFSVNALPFVVTRIKMADSAAIKVIVKADGQFFTNSKNVEVLSNGCG